MAITAQDALIQMIKDDSDVSSLAGSRVFPDIAPENPRKPYVVVTQISAPRPHHMGGASGIVFNRLQVDGFAKSRLQAKDLKDRIRLATDGYTGTVSVAAQTFTFRRCDMVSDNDAYVQPVPGEDTGGVRQISLDYETTNAETVPTFS